MIKRIWAWVTGGELVWLKDCDSEVTLTIAYVDPWGDLIAERWWPLKTTIVKLEEDGTIEGSYVKEWVRYKGWPNKATSSS